MKKLTYLISFLLAYAFVSNVLGQWAHVSPPLYVNYLYNDGATLYAGAVDSGSVWFSLDNGVSWKNIVALHLNDEINSIVRSGKYLFVGASSTGIWRSDDIGITWANMSSGLPPGKSINCLATNGHSIFAAMRNGIARTDNYGTSWSLVLSLPTEISPSSSLAFSKENLFAATDSGLYRTSDNGDSWELVLKSLATGVGIIDSTILCSIYPGMYRSTNNGIDWTLDTNRNGRGISIFYVYGNNIFTSIGGGSTTNIYLSTDRGLSWSDLGQVHRIRSLAVSGTNLVAGSTNTGIWYRPLSGILDVKKNNQIEIQLSPNPTTGTITIHNAPENLTSITVMNVLGEKVAELANLLTSDFTIDLSKLVPGMYYARFFAGSSVVVKKIIKE